MNTELVLSGVAAALGFIGVGMAVMRLRLLGSERRPGWTVAGLLGSASAALLGSTQLFSHERTTLALASDVALILGAASIVVLARMWRLSR